MMSLRALLGAFLQPLRMISCHLLLCFCFLRKKHLQLSSCPALAAEVKPKVEVVTYHCETCGSEIFLSVEGPMRRRCFFLDWVLVGRRLKGGKSQTSQSVVKLAKSGKYRVGQVKTTSNSFKLQSCVGMKIFGLVF